MPTTTQFELRLAGRMSRLGTETAFEVLNRARALEKQGKEIIHLEIGEPDFNTPANIIEAGVDALHMGWTHYGPAAGLPDLRQAIADYVSHTRKVPVSSDEVVVVPGGKPIIFFSILALIDAGDEVIYPNPGFPIYESMINYSLGKAVPIPLREERDFSVDVKELASLITDRTIRRAACSPEKTFWISPTPSAIATSWFCRTKFIAASFLKASTFPS
jgi:aspartate/methionine/tyrosine aminotransferase